MEKETGNWKQRMSNGWWKGWGWFSPCSLSLRVISIKFLLVISMLCKTEWSWELRTWSHKMNLLDVLSTSPHYFCRKWIGVTNDNSNFDLGFFFPIPVPVTLLVTAIVSFFEQPLCPSSKMSEKRKKPRRQLEARWRGPVLTQRLRDHVLCATRYLLCPPVPLGSVDIDNLVCDIQCIVKSLSILMSLKILFFQFINKFNVVYDRGMGRRMRGTLF